MGLLLATVILFISFSSLVHAECAGSLVGQFAPVMGESLGLHDIQIPVGITHDLATVPYCQAVFPADSNGMHRSCCDSATFHRLRSFADAVATHIKHVQQNLDALHDYNPEHHPNLPAEYATALATLRTAYNTFSAEFFPHYQTCAVEFHNYIGGVLCLLCRTDFYPTIVNHTENGLEWHFKPETCNDLVTACSPALLDVRTFVLAYAQFANDIANIVVPGATTAPAGETLAPVSDFDILADVSGATLDDKVRTWVCNLHARGFEDIDPMNTDAIHMELGTALENAHLPTHAPMAMGKRDRLRDGVKHALHVQHHVPRQMASSTNVYDSSAVANPTTSGAQVTLLPSAATSTAVASFVVVFVLSMVCSSM